MVALLAALSLPEWRAHPWRHALALAAVALGVALGLAVHLVNASALAEFGAAVRAAGGTPDLELRAAGAAGWGQGRIDEALYPRLAALPTVALASPVVEATAGVAGADGPRATLRVLGLDAFVAAALNPPLAPRPDDGDPLAVVDPARLYLNAAARRLVGDATTITLHTAQGEATLAVAGSVAAAGPPLAVIDIAGAQALFGHLGTLTRIDLRLAPGADAEAVLRILPPGVRAARPDEATERMANLSRAYRVNLTVLSLVALFTGGFLVFSVQALSVARRVPQFALLGVLGLAARERLRLVLAEGLVIGVVGSALGLALGAALAAAALRLLGGDLGGGYFQGLAPTLHWSAGAAAAYAGLGVVAALAGAWVPAREAAALAPAQALKGLGGEALRGAPAWAGPLTLVAAAALATLPPVAGLPLAAYASVALALVGGILCVPAAVALLGLVLGRVLDTRRHALALLAVQRARGERAQAAVAVAGVVAALGLAVALTVMVGSFRHALDDWLGQLLPADLYLRGAGAVLPPGLAASAAAVPGVERVQPQRLLMLTLDARQPAVALLARALPPDPERALPLVGDVAEPAPGAVAVYASEALAALYGARVGATLELPLPAPAGATRVFVRGLWRDYARQHGSVLMALDDYRRLTGDTAVSELALWLRPAADVAAVQQALRDAAAPAPLELATTTELRAFSMRLFDRSFAITRYLQAVAIAIGLVGIAASWSAQVLARRKEFGMLAHLGVTRREVLALVAAEAGLWTGAGAVLGVALGLGVSVVLVHVVNPQSFHWSMPMTVPWPDLAALAAAVLGAGTLTAVAAARAAAGRDAALAVKEDW